MNRFFIISIIFLFSSSIYSSDNFDKVVRTKSELCSKPKIFKNAKELSIGTKVTIIDTTPIFGIIYGKESPWIKIKTQDGDTGFVLLGEISTLEGLVNEKRTIEEAKNKPLPDLSKYISKSYTNFRDFDTLLQSAEFIALDSSFTLSAYVYDHNENFNIFVFSKLLGHNGPNPINKLLDVLVVDKRHFKNVSAVSLKDCKVKNTNEIGSIIGVYSVENQGKNKNEEFTPEKAWLVNKKTGKIEVFPSSQCTCSPEPAGW